jgi:putative heme transporter
MPGCRVTAVTTRRVPVRLVFRPRAILLVIGLVVAGVLTLSSLQAAVGVLVNLLVAGAVAALIRPFVLRLARRMRLGIAIALVLAATIGAAAGVLVVTAVDLNSATQSISRELRVSLDDLPQEGLVAESIRSLDLDDKSVDAIENVPNWLVFGSDSPLGGLDRLSRALLLFVLGFVFITRGPAVVFGTIGLVGDPLRRSVLTEAVRAAYRVGGAATRRTLVVTALNGSVAAVLAFALGLPAPLALGLWAAGWGLVPAAGMAIGWAPVLALAIGVGGGPAAGVLSVLVLAAVVAGRLWLLRHWVAARTVAVNRVVLAVLFLCGWNLAGILGAIIGVFVASGLAAAIAASGSLAAMGITWMNDEAPEPADPAPHAPPATLDNGGPIVSDRTTTGNGTTVPPPFSTAGHNGDTVELLVDVSVRSGVVAIAMLAVLVLGWYLVFDQSGVGLALLIGFIVALALNPIIERVSERIGNHRATAIAAVFSLFMIGVAAFAAFAVPAAVDQARTIPEQVPQLVRQLAELPVVGPGIRDLNLEDRLSETLDSLPAVLDTQNTAVDSVAARAGDGLAIALWAFILVICLLADGPSLLRGVHDTIPLRRRPRVEQLADLGYRSFGRYWGGSILIAGINASVITTIALAARLPMAPVLGLWSGMCSLIPQIGGLLGGGTLVIIAMSQGLTTGLVVLGIYLVYQTTENNVLLPVVIGKSVQLSPLAAMTAILVGLAVGGVLGAILATPLAGVVKLAYRELWGTPDDLTSPSGTDPPADAQPGPIAPSTAPAIAPTSAPDASGAPAV